MSGHYTLSGHVMTAPPAEAGLHLVATPIGNLRDITLRALDVIAACDVLACEDTRVTRKLLDRYGIDRRMLAYHEHNAQSAGPKLLEALGAGQSVALVSDAGTPLVSDPGYRLVAEALEAGHRVIPVPGASALLAGLCASGLPTDDFRFCGFLPAKDKARRDRLTALAHEPSTLVFFEAPGRLQATLAAMVACFGADRPVSVGRELTKRFETVRTGPAEAIASRFADESIKGEIVVMVAPSAQRSAPVTDAEIDALLTGLLAEMPVSKAAREAAAMTGRAKADLYQRCLALKSDDG